MQKFFTQIANYFDDYKAKNFDRFYGVETCERLSVDGLDLSDGMERYAKPYQASRFALVQRCFAALPIDPNQSTFVDYGCGKGRVLMLAACFGFRHLVGVEFSKKLIKRCMQNFQLFRPQIDSFFELQLFHENALHFPVPSQANVFYFFNPFQANLLWEVLCNILLASDGKQDLFFVYVTPIYQKLFEDLGCESIFFHPHWSLNRQAKIYRLSAAQVQMYQK